MGKMRVSHSMCLDETIYETGIANKAVFINMLLEWMPDKTIGKMIKHYGHVENLPGLLPRPKKAKKGTKEPKGIPGIDREWMEEEDPWCRVC